MKLRAITLTNVRKFAGRTASLTEIGDGISVVSEANEFGKSTFFDALHALFFEKFGATSRTIRSLQPHSGGAVRVAVEIETADGRFTVEKRWLAQKGASVTDSAGRRVATDGEAEAWIAQVAGDGEGPTGLLWVRQGVVGLEPADASRDEKVRAKEVRRDLLSSFAGEIDAMTGGQRMDRVLRRCEEDLADFTTSGGSPSGVWKAVRSETKQLSEEHDRLDAACRDLGAALAQRSAEIEHLARLDAPGARARREADLAEAGRVAKLAEEHADKLREAGQQTRIAGLEEAEAQRALDALLSAETALATARDQHGKAADNAAATLDAVQSAEARAEAAHSEHQILERELRLLRAALTAAHRRDAVAGAVRRAGELAERLSKAETHRAAREAAEARVAANSATPALLAKAEAAAADVARLEGFLAAQAPSLRLDYSGELRVSADGRNLPGGEDIPFATKIRLDIPAVGMLEVRAGIGGRAETIEADLNKARERLGKVIAACGAKTIDGARRMAGDRGTDEAAARLAAELMSAIAPEGLDVLQGEVAVACAAAAGAEEIGETRSVEEISTEIDRVTSHEIRARVAMRTAEQRLSNAREQAASASADLMSANRSLDVALTALGSLDTLVDRKSAAARQLAVETEKRKASEASEAALRADAPDLLSAKANLKRAADAEAAAAKRRQQLSESLSALSARIETQAEQGVEVRRDEIAGQLAEARDREARLAAEAAALTRLREVLRSARRAAREAYFGPVQQELGPLLSILHGGAALSFDSDTLLPQALSRGGDLEDMQSLSGGTQEQIAILTRLAFARLYARRGREVPIILDDALVYSDDSRIVKMFTALNRVAIQQQIIVFSCRQLAFESLGGDRPKIRIGEALT